MITATGALRVLIIEKQTLFAKAIAQVLSADPDIKVVGIAPSRETALLAKDIDVVVIDIDTEEIDDVVEQFKSRSPETRVCALSAHTQGELMQHCLAAGADAYIVKDSSLQELVAAIKTLGEGASYVDPRVAASLLRRRGPSKRLTNELSPRERESFGSSLKGSRIAISAPPRPIRENDQESRQPHLCEDPLHRAIAGRGPRDQDRPGVAVPLARAKRRTRRLR